MKFEVEKKNHKKDWIIAISTILLIGIVLAVKNSFAKYSSVKTVHLVNSTVNYTKGDFSIVAMYKNDGSGDTEITTMPESGYTINQDKSYCSVNGINDTNVILKTIDGHHTFENLQKSSKCYLYFSKITGIDLIKASSKGIYPTGNSFTKKSDSTDTGIYETEDDFGTSYYFRGDEDKLNNWVKFAGFYWRIIRINGNDSIRMIYSGVADGLPNESNKTGETTGIGKYEYNIPNNDATYIGYMIGLNNTGATSNEEEAYSNKYDSNAKKILDSWYKENIGNKNLTIYLDKETGFCNDREIYTKPLNYVMSHAPYGRLFETICLDGSCSGNYRTIQTPKLECTNKDRDLFTVTKARMGNKKLTYPIGLITSDEVIYAGAFFGTNNKTYYLYTNEMYHTISPYSSNGHATNSPSIFRVDNDGMLMASSANNSIGLRPVINLLPTAITSGDGSESNPFIA